MSDVTVSSNRGLNEGEKIYYPLNEKELFTMTEKKNILTSQSPVLHSLPLEELLFIVITNKSLPNLPSVTSPAQNSAVGLSRAGRA